MKALPTTILLFVLFISSNIFGQETVLSFKNEDVSNRMHKESYSFSNEINKDLATVLIERNSVYAYLFDAEFNPTANVESKKLKMDLTEVIGYRIDHLIYHILYANDKKSKFGFLTIDFENKTMEFTESNINLENDTYINALNYKNNIYLLSANNLDLNLRILDSSLNFKLDKSFVLEGLKDETLLVENQKKVGLFFNTRSKVSAVSKIDTRVPNTIEQTSSQGKIYQTKQQVYFTFEADNIGTYVYDLNLETYALNFKTFQYPKGKQGEFKKFNSFIYETNLYQIAISKDEMWFTVQTIDAKPIKEFYIHKEASIKFKNSPIIQEGATALPVVRNREMEETSKYLRKISSGEIGISVLKEDNAYYVTLGGFELVQNNMVMGSSTSSAPTNFATYNPAHGSYFSYTDTKSTYFNAIFDMEYQHIKGKLKKNVFDTIKTYQNSKKYISAEDVFFHNNSLYFGYFNQKGSTYNLVKF